MTTLRVPPVVHEDALIRKYFSFDAPHPGFVLGPGDDAAILDWDGPCVVCTDLFLEGAHFDPGTDPRDVGYKALAVNLSDVAAMGAVPQYFTLALAMPAADEPWIAGFSQGLQEIARSREVVLAGGDLSRGSLAVTITVLASLEGPEPPLRRDRAQAGQIIAVSGTVGDAAYARRHPDSAPPEILQALHRPEPRLALGQALRGLATAAMDVSDGLLLDLGRMLAASGCGASVHLDRVPLAPAVAAEREESGDWFRTLGGGEDYELIFTAPDSQWDRILRMAQEMDLPVTRIGTVEEGQDMRLLDKGKPVSPPAQLGFDHFATSTA